MNKLFWKLEYLTLKKEYKELIETFVKDINKVLSEGRPYNSIQEVKEKWENKL